MCCGIRSFTVFKYHIFEDRVLPAVLLSCEFMQLIESNVFLGTRNKQFYY